MPVRRLLLLFAALSCQTTVALAQVADSVAFRRGQWGLEFVGGFGGFGAAGILRFSSPTRALVADGSLTTNHSSSMYDTVGVSETDYTWSFRVGTRGYRMGQQNVYSFMTLGLTANFRDARIANAGGTSIEQSYGGGLFADLGATWLITPHLALGTKVGGTLLYSYQRDTSTLAGPTRGHAISLSLGNIALGGQLYF